MLGRDASAVGVGAAMIIALLPGFRVFRGLDGTIATSDGVPRTIVLFALYGRGFDVSINLRHRMTDAWAPLRCKCRGFYLRLVPRWVSRRLYLPAVGCAFYRREAS